MSMISIIIAACFKDPDDGMDLTLILLQGRLLEEM